MKKGLLWAGAGLLGLIAVFGIVQTLASERVEVVELFTVDAQEQEHVTRLWVVDHMGHPYLRVSAAGSGWFDRLRARPEIRLMRGGEVLPYRAAPKLEEREIINRLMYEKYGWGDTFFARLYGGREGSTPIELRTISTTH